MRNAIRALAEIIAAAPADAATRERWLDRLWDAYQDDGIPYLESLSDEWGGLCASPEAASRWADRLVGICKRVWSPDTEGRGYFEGTTACLSALLAAGRYEDILELLAMAPYQLWFYRQYGVKALAALGRPAEAIRYAEAERWEGDSPAAIACVCEEVLLSAGHADEAYASYGLVANQRGTYLAWFRAVAKKYPDKPQSEVLADLVAHTPGEEGKWFAAAKSAKLFDEAIVVANRTPCAPKPRTTHRPADALAARAEGQGGKGGRVGVLADSSARTHALGYSIPRSCMTAALRAWARWLAGRSPRRSA